MSDSNKDLVVHHLTIETMTEEIKKDLYDFCVFAAQDDSRAVENWSVENWENNSSSLLHCLYKEKRFSEGRGIFSLLYDKQQLISISGVYRSDFDPQIFIGGVRAFTLADFRSRGMVERGSFPHGDHLFPAQMEWAKSQGGRAFLMTFNDHNFRLAQLILRLGSDQAAFLGVKVSDAARRFFEGFELYPKKLIIKSVPQRVLIKKIDPTFESAFKSLEVSE